MFRPENALSQATRANETVYRNSDGLVIDPGDINKQPQPQTLPQLGMAAVEAFKLDQKTIAEFDAPDKADAVNSVLQPHHTLYPDRF